MFRKTFLSIIFTITATLAVCFTVNAQTAPLGGSVVLQKDGKTEPVASAVIEVYRTDIKGFYSTKTDKKGEFRFVGVNYGDYVIAVSAPNCAPTTYPNVRAGQENIKILMGPGDGRKYTEAEAKRSASDSKSGETVSEVSEEEKRERAETEKKNAEISSKNEKMKNADAVAIKSNSEGWAALKANNFDLAITKFSEGIDAVPDFVDTTPILLNGKVDALRGKGHIIYKEGNASTDRTIRRAKWDEANKFYDEGLEGFQRALTIIKSAPPTTDAVMLKRRETITLSLYTTATEIHRLKAVTGVDASKTVEANTVITEYLALEPDPAKKLEAQMVLGSIMVKTGDFARAVEVYRQILAVKPDHAEANGQLGLSLFGLATASEPENKAMEQEGLNYMQKYIEMSPVSPTDTPAVKELKESIKQIVDDLKSQKMAPQKVPSAPKKRN